MPQVHDSLVKTLFTNTEDAASAIASALPREVARRIDWTTLKHENFQLVDQKLKEYYTDLVFSAKVEGRQLYIYILYEHQSTPNRLMAFRLLRYMVLIWGQWLGNRKTAKRLPAVLPMVLHHDELRWAAPTDFHSVIDLPEDLLQILAPHLPQFQFILDDLTTTDDAALRDRSLTALMAAGLVVLKKARGSTDLWRDFGAWQDVFVRAANAPNGLDAFRLLMEYLSRVAEVDSADILEFAKAIGPTAEQAYMTAAQKIGIENKEKWNKEGEETVLLRLLERRFGPLSEAVTERVHAATSAELLLWAERILDATSLDQVFEGS